MTGFYAAGAQPFQLFASPGIPTWRQPQVAALGAVMAQWSLVGAEPPLISVPTGVGKTAIALAAPFLVAATRTLVVVPTQELRRQTVERFRSQDVLRAIGALNVVDDFDPPVVVEARGRTSDWASLQDADVVVGIPASVSPAHYPEGEQPPPDLFDLVIVDEAHHAPAATWLSILDHFAARSLLLTATPHRRDRRRLPGKLAYYYPLRQALDEDLYQPVDPRILPAPDGASREDIDRLIVDEVVALLATPEHASSQMLVRAGTRQRAQELEELYASAGLQVPVLHSGLGAARQRDLVQQLRDGVHRGIVMVGMLVEGFDLPSLRVAAYHDKHKSLEPTAQLIGRLARVSDQFPQRSVLVTARDIDVYPHLEGAVRNLYLEDRDWVTVLPGIIDGFVEDDVNNTEYARSFDPSPGQVDLAHICPLRRARIFEVRSDGPWAPAFADGDLPDELSVGEKFAGKRILYAGTNPDHTTLLIVTGERSRPRWNSGDELDSIEYDLHLVSYRVATHVDQPDLLLVNTARLGAQNELLAVIGAAEIVRQGDVDRMQRAFDSLQRISVSSVGVRSTYGAARGTPSYKMFAGSSIETGLRGTDTAQAALGHAMAQVAGGPGTFTAGVSTGKSKYWETRYTPLRLYEEFVADLASRYWFPTTAPSGPLLPQINRGQTLVSWPSAPVLAALIDYALIGTEWTIDGSGSLDLADLVAGDEACAQGAPPPSAPDRVPLALLLPDNAADVVVWTGEMDLLGTVESTSPPASARRGFSNPTLLSGLLEERPPTLFFADGTTVRGTEMFPPPNIVSTLPDGLVQSVPWTGVDIQAETHRRAAVNGVGISVHEWIERHLVARPLRGASRWIIRNDGSGEIADHIVIEEMSSGQVQVDLWHSKFAGGAPSVRVTDFEVVTAQAIKSRRWPTDRQLWARLGERLEGREHPPAVLVDGNASQLRVVLGLDPTSDDSSFAKRKPAVISTIGIVQPGLSLAQLETKAATGDISAVQIVQLLSTFRDAVMQVADAAVVTSP